jgi:hypothetical protein
MSSKLFKALADLAEPPKENLVSCFILEEIIDHIDVLKDEFPEVKISTLKKHLWWIRNKRLDPEEHLRGLLQTFKETESFKDAFAQLDDSMKIQLKVFMSGGSEDQILAAGKHEGYFHLPPSPPVHNHFQEMVHMVEHKTEDFVHPKQVNGVNGTNRYVEERAKTSDGYPHIYEDEAETKVMEVSCLFTSIKLSSFPSVLFETFCFSTVSSIYSFYKAAFSCQNGK